MLKKIVIIGPESTGKSTLCQELAEYFETIWCPEYAREYLLTNGTDYSFQDLLTIAKGQIALEEKLAEMDTIVSKLDTLEAKVEKYRPKTAQEKLQLRSLDSGPFKQNLADFFDEKKDEMEQTGKNEYVLTQDEVESFSPSDIEKSFNEPMEDEDDILLNKFNS
jgi:adenylate kinase family enzyme